MRKEDVITYFGNPTQVAKYLGIYPAAVYQWGERVPEKQAARLDRMTDGELQYRPEVYAPIASTESVSREPAA